MINNSGIGKKKLSQCNNSGTSAGDSLPSCATRIICLSPCWWCVLPLFHQRSQCSNCNCYIDLVQFFTAKENKQRITETDWKYWPSWGSVFPKQTWKPDKQTRNKRIPVNFAIRANSRKLAVCQEDCMLSRNIRWLQSETFSSENTDFLCLNCLWIDPRLLVMLII